LQMRLLPQALVVAAMLDKNHLTNIPDSLSFANG
jgi:hypothetical protein